MTSRDVPDGTWKARRKRFETLPLVSESASAYASGDRHPRNDLGRRRRRRRRRHHTRHVERPDAPSTVDRLSGPAHGRVEGATAAPRPQRSATASLSWHCMALTNCFGPCAGPAWASASAYGRVGASERASPIQRLERSPKPRVPDINSRVDVCRRSVGLPASQPASLSVCLSACLSAESNEKRVVVVRDCLVQVQPDRILKLEFSTL